MATYFWVGGETSAAGTSYSNGLGNFTGKTGAENMDWVLAFDWNNPRNWYTRTGNIPSQFFYSRSTRSPGANDIAIIGTVDFLGGISGGILPIAKAPCLWGGASLSGTTTTWLGAGVSGTIQNNTGTGNGALSSTNLGGGRVGTQYPFTWFGADGFVNSVLGGSADTSPLYDAQANGFTLSLGIWGGSSWESLVQAVAATGAAAVARLNNISLRVDQFNTFTNNVEFGPASNDAARHRGSVNVNLLKNLRGITGGFANQTNFSQTTSARCKVSGYATNIFVSPASAPQEPVPFYSPRPILTASGLTCGSLLAYLSSGSILFDATSNFAQADINPLSNYTFLQFQNKFNRLAVLADLNPGSTLSGNSLAPELKVANHYSVSSLATPSGGGGSVNYYGIVLGSQGSTFSANRVQIGDQIVGASGSSGGAMGLAESLVYFGGNSKINTLEVSRGIVSAWPLGADSSQCSVDVGELLMTNSTLDLSTVPPIDTWSFGVQSVSGGQVTINGGIIFRDEDSFVRGSQGVRLWNEQLILSGSALPSTAPPKKGNPGVSPTIA